MNQKPDYQFEFRIVDKTTGEVVVRDYTYLTTIDRNGACESIDIHVSSLLRGFERGVRVEYEGKNYLENLSQDA